MVKSRRPAAAEASQTGRLAGRRDTDVLVYMTFPAAHRVTLCSAKPIERRDGKINRRKKSSAYYQMTRPSSASGATVHEQNDEWVS